MLRHLQILGSRSSLLKSIVFSLIGQSTNEMVLERDHEEILAVDRNQNETVFLKALPFPQA